MADTELWGEILKGVAAGGQAYGRGLQQKATADDRAKKKQEEEKRLFEQGNVAYRILGELESDPDPWEDIPTGEVVAKLQEKLGFALEDKYVKKLESIQEARRERAQKAAEEANQPSLEDLYMEPFEGGMVPEEQAPYLQLGPHAQEMGYGAGPPQTKGGYQDYVQDMTPYVTELMQQQEFPVHPSEIQRRVDEGKYQRKLRAAKEKKQIEDIVKPPEPGLSDEEKGVADAKRYLAKMGHILDSDKKPTTTAEKNQIFKDAKNEILLIADRIYQQLGVDAKEATGVERIDGFPALEKITTSGKRAVTGKGRIWDDEENALVLESLRSLARDWRQIGSVEWWKGANSVFEKPTTKDMPTDWPGTEGDWLEYKRRKGIE